MLMQVEYLNAYQDDASLHSFSQDHKEPHGNYHQA